MPWVAGASTGRKTPQKHGSELDKGVDPKPDLLSSPSSHVAIPLPSSAFSCPPSHRLPGEPLLGSLIWSFLIRQRWT